MQLLLVRSLWAAPAVGLTSGTLKHTRAPSHAQRALSAACNTDHALCRVQRLWGAGFTCSPQSYKVVHEGPSSSSTCNIPHCIIKAIQTTRGVFGNACLPQGSARLDALVSLSWPRVRVCVIVSPPPRQRCHLYNHPNQLLQPFGFFPLCAERWATPPSCATTTALPRSTTTSTAEACFYPLSHRRELCSIPKTSSAPSG